MVGWHSPTFWIVVGIVVLVLFGGKKLPDAARGLGRSMRIFKSEMDEMKTESEKKPPTTEQAQVTDTSIDVETVQPSDADRKTA